MGIDADFPGIAPGRRAGVEVRSKPGGGGATLPQPATARLEAPLSDYWAERVDQHAGGAGDRGDTYAGVRITKLPEDLRVYEHLLWIARPDVVIELGAQFGGSALWFRDRLDALRRYTPLGAPRVISVDRRVDLARETVGAVEPDHESTITFLDGDVTDPELPALVERHLPGGARCLVVEDSAHVHETTLAALRGFARFVPPGGFFVVEDGSVDIEPMRARPDWPRGVLPAVGEWLDSEAGAEFVCRTDLELYGITSHPFGILQRRLGEVASGGGRADADAGADAAESARSAGADPASEIESVEDPEARLQLVAERLDAARTEAADLRRRLARAKARRRRETKRRKQAERELRTSGASPVSRARAALSRLRGS